MYILQQKNLVLNNIELNKEDIINKKKIIDSISNKKKTSQQYLIDIFENSDIVINKKFKDTILKKKNDYINSIDSINSVSNNYKYFSKEDVVEFNKFINKNNIDKDSKEFFISFASLTDWLDELSEHSCIGILANVQTGYLGKLGKADFLLFEPSFDFYSGVDYLYSLADILKKSKDKDLNNLTVIDDSMKNSCNGIFLLYINRFHWKSAKKFLPVITSCFMSHSPFCFTDNYILTYFIALVRYGNSINSNRDGKIFLSLWRTCYEIAKENRYLNRFLNFIKNIDYKKTTYDIVLGQSLLIYLKDETIDKIYSDIFYFILGRFFSNKKFKKISKNMSSAEFKYSMNYLIGKFYCSWNYKNLINNVKIRKYLFDNFDIKELPNRLDANYGVIDVSFLDYIKKYKENDNLNDGLIKIDKTKIYNITFYKLLNKNPENYSLDTDIDELYKLLITS